METVEAQEAPESGLERMGLVPSVALGGGRGRNVCPCEPTPPPERSPRTPELSIALPQLPQCRAKARGTKGSIWVINRLFRILEGRGLRPSKPASPNSYLELFPEFGRTNELTRVA